MKWWRTWITTANTSTQYLTVLFSPFILLLNILTEWPLCLQLENYYSWGHFVMAIIYKADCVYIAFGDHILVIHTFTFLHPLDLLLVGSDAPALGRRSTCNWNKSRTDKRLYLHCDHRVLRLKTASYQLVCELTVEDYLLPPTKFNMQLAPADKGVFWWMIASQPRE